MNEPTLSEQIAESRQRTRESIERTRKAMDAPPEPLPLNLRIVGWVSCVAFCVVLVSVAVAAVLGTWWMIQKVAL